MSHWYGAFQNFQGTRSHLKEALSALADDETLEIAEAELIELACKDQDAMSAWRCMHLTRDVLQADYTPALSSDFAAQLSDRIASEDSLAIADMESEGVVSMGAARERIARRKTSRSAGQQTMASSATQNEPFRLWKPVAGLGMAASLAGATFLFAQLWQTDQADSGQIAALQNTTIDESLIQTAALTENTEQNAEVAAAGEFATQIANGGTRWRMDSELPRNKQIEQRLNALLTNHLEDASMGRVTGMLSHSRARCFLFVSRFCVTGGFEY